MPLYRPDRATEGERLMHSEGEPLRAGVHRRAVERAATALDAHAAAGGALPGFALDAGLEQEEVDAAVRGGLERARPARGGAAVATRLLAPACEYPRLVLRSLALELGH